MRLTAGQASVKASSDRTKYDSLEVGHALCDDILNQIWICIDKHKPIIDEREFCVVMVIASDPLIHNVMRRKFYAWPYLPSPRPNQSVFLYRKGSDDIQRLWVLPEANAMAVLSTMGFVAPRYRTMQAWSNAFFNGEFWEYIRKEHQIFMLSESEYLDANREKLIKSGCKQSDSLPAEPFDFSKIRTDKVVNTLVPVLH
jgi:hypothetical protein